MRLVNILGPEATTVVIISMVFAIGMLAGADTPGHPPKDGAAIMTADHR